MFAMYDDDGLNFRSTIDNLYNLHKITSSNTVKNNANNQNKQNFHDTLYKGKITEEAKNKYMQITNMDIQHDIFHVNQLMNTHVITIEDTTTIKECYDLMQEYSIQQLPIIADNKLHLKGIVTIHDIIRYIFNDIQYAEHNANNKICDISTKKVITTDPISDIRRVAKVMIDFKINAIPVVNSDDVILGVVSRYDMINALASIPHLQVWA